MGGRVIPGAGRTVPGNRFDLLDGIEPATPPSVSVIVVHHEQDAALARTLGALRAQTHPAERREVIVVDDGSARAPDVPGDVRLIVQEDRGARPGAARNLGVERSTGEVLCFLDADTAPEPGYLTALTRLPAIAPDAVTVGRRRHTALPADAPLRDAASHELPEPAWLRDGYGRTRDLLDADDRSYRYVISAVLACTRRFFAEVGPFADFDVYGGEDWEWAHRAWRAGAILAHVPTAVAWHDGPEWAGRGAQPARRAQKNAETRRLSGLIDVAGSRGRGLRGMGSETVVRIDAPGTASQAFRCVDGLLEALPRATVVVPDATAFVRDCRVIEPGPGAPAHPALAIELARPVAVDPDGLRAACAEVRATELTLLTLVDEGGEALLHLGDGRSRARAVRWRDAAALAGVVRSAAGIAVALEPEPDLEAWLGGWGEPTFAGGGAR